MKWKRFGRKRSWPNTKVLLRHHLESLRKTTKTLSHVSRSPGRNLNSGPPEYDAGMLTIRPRLSVFIEDDSELKGTTILTY
jgi:hypothetical protein